MKMGCFGLGMGYSFCIWYCFCGFIFGFVKGEYEVGTVFVNGNYSIGKTDSNFICATMDWWPPQKCDYGTCPWGNASLFNIDLNNTILINAIKAFSPLKIRLGGTLQDELIYETEDQQQPCIPFRNTFTQGCLPLSRWDQLNSFFNKTGAVVTFGLNILIGKSINPGGVVLGNWNYTNAESFMRYTVKKGYEIHGWELGNEKVGKNSGLKISPDQYASDTTSLRKIVNEIYSGVEPKPLIMAPAGFFDEDWWSEFIPKANNSTNVTTHHIYNLGNDNGLVNKILNANFLDGEASVFRDLQSIIQKSGTGVAAWVGEAGGAYNSGHNLVSNTFVNSFWYLDQLGMASSYGTKTYCRQSLIGGYYGLLNTTTFMPQPDYYSALLWHQLMGRNVLATNFSGTKNLRAYAHCSKKSEGITLLLINLDRSTPIKIEVVINDQYKSHRGQQKDQESRSEYHLTPKDGDIQSQVMLLNGKSLALDSNREIPYLKGQTVNSSEPIIVDPFSIVFADIQNIKLQACGQNDSTPQSPPKHSMAPKSNNFLCHSFYIIFISYFLFFTIN